MDLSAYLIPGWSPVIRPAPATRSWMDELPAKFGYRCLPLSIANAHGWEALCPAAFRARWNGGGGVNDIEIEGGQHHAGGPVNVFGHGVLTFHINAIFRTDPGWNLWIGGSPNFFIHGIQALTGIVETDWAYPTFTMNWKFTRPNEWVEFAAGDPTCFFFPVQRGVLSKVKPRAMPAPPADDATWRAWSQKRDALKAREHSGQPIPTEDQWSKDYFRAVTLEGKPVELGDAPRHETKLRLYPFDGLQAEVPAAPPLPPLPATPAIHPAEKARMDLNRSQAWTAWHLRNLATLAAMDPGVVDDKARRFFSWNYRAASPALFNLEGRWPAMDWSPMTLRDKLGNPSVEVQAGRDSDPDFEAGKMRHTARMPLHEFLDRIENEGGNDVYMTANNAGANRDALAPLFSDIGDLPSCLMPDASLGFPWLGGQTMTPCHHDRTQNALIQVVGNKHVRLFAPLDVGLMDNHTAVFSRLGWIDDEMAQARRLPYADVQLNAGQVLFIPVGWWHQVKALSPFSATLLYTSFRWPNYFPTEDSVLDT